MNMLEKILTIRENEILQYLLKGCSRREIACHLCISEHTVKAHIEKIYKKFNINNRIQLIIYLIKNKLINIDELLI